MQYENFITNWNRYENIKICHREIKFNKSMSSKTSSFIIEMRRCWESTWNVKWEFKLKSTWSRWWIKFEWRTTQCWSSFIKFTNILLSLLLFSVFNLGLLNRFYLKDILMRVEKNWHVCHLVIDTCLIKLKILLSETLQKCC